MSLHSQAATRGERGRRQNSVAAGFSCLDLCILQTDFLISTLSMEAASDCYISVSLGVREKMGEGTKSLDTVIPDYALKSGPWGRALRRSLARAGLRHAQKHAQ